MTRQEAFAKFNNDGAEVLIISKTSPRVIFQGHQMLTLDKYLFYDREDKKLYDVFIIITKINDDEKIIEWRIQNE